MIFAPPIARVAAKMLSQKSNCVIVSRVHISPTQPIYRLQWHLQDYSQSGTLPDEAEPAPKFVKFFMYLDELDASLRALSDVATTQQTLAHLVAAVAAALADTTGAFWRSATFGSAGIHQFVLDMRFFIEAAGYFANCAEPLLARAIEAAMSSYARHNDEPVRGEQWFEQRVRESVEQLSKRARAATTLRVAGPRGGQAAVGAAANVAPAEPPTPSSAAAPRRASPAPSTAAAGSSLLLSPAASPSPAGMSPRLTSRAGMRKRKVQKSKTAH
jgi:hypothetical protein